MRKLKSLFVLLAMGSLKVFGHCFYRTRISWVGEKPEDAFKNVKLGLLINHTSLFDPIFITAVPWSMVYELARHSVFPAADVTLEKPIIGHLLKLVSPKVIAITRKRDASWDHFLGQIREEDVIFMAPEGRMMRPNGLDKHGKPMSIKGGVFDILGCYTAGNVLIGYSEGLHHIQAPGQGIPKVFKTIGIKFEQISVQELKLKVGFEPRSRQSKRQLVDFLQERRDKYCPSQAS